MVHTDMSICVDISILMNAGIAREANFLDNVSVLRCAAFDGCDVLLRGMRMFLESVAVQTKAMDALHDTVLFGCDEDGEDGDDGSRKALRRATLFNCDALATIVSAMRAHPSEMTVIRGSFYLLSQLLVGDGTADGECAASVAEAAGVFDSVLVVMMANPVDLELHAQGLHVMSYYASKSAAAAAALLCAVDPNRAYPRIDTDVFQHSRRIERDPADAPAFRVLMNGDLLRLVLRKFCAEEASVQHATVVMSGVSHGMRAAARELVVDAEWLAPLLTCAEAFVRDVPGYHRQTVDTPAAMLHGMRMYRSRASVQVAALDALTQLTLVGYIGTDCSDKTVRRGLLCDSGALACVVLTMRAHRSNNDVNEYCFALLFSLLHRSCDCESTTYDSIVKLANDTSVFEQMLHNMLKNPTAYSLWLKGHSIMLRYAAGSVIAATTLKHAEASMPGLRKRT